MLQVEPLDERDQASPVETVGVHGVVHRLVAAPEAEEIGRHHPRTGPHEHRDHLAVQVRPRRLAVQTQEHPVRIGRPLVHAGHPQTVETRQVVDVPRLERKAAEVLEPVVGGADHLQRCLLVSRGVAWGESTCIDRTLLRSLSPGPDADADADERDGVSSQVEWRESRS